MNKLLNGFKANILKIPLYKLATYILFLTTFLFSQWWVPSHSWKEVFPFFHWSLFSAPPHLVERYNLQILKVDGEVLEEPCFYYDCPFLESAPITKLYYSIQEFGNAVAEVRGKEIEDLRFVIESQIFRDHKEYTYNLLREKIEPRQFVLSQKVESRAIVSTILSEETIGE